MEESLKLDQTKSARKHNRSRQTSRDQHNNALMMGKGTSDERF